MGIQLSISDTPANIRDSLAVHRRVQRLQYCNTHMWGWRSRFKMTGCTCMIRGNFDGKRLPVTSVRDDVDYDNVAESDFMHVLCNGLRIDLTEYRRGTDQAHYKTMQRLYDRNWALESCIGAVEKRYPNTERNPQYARVMSHQQSIRLNVMTNDELANTRHDTRDVKPPCVSRKAPWQISLKSCTHGRV